MRHPHARVGARMAVVGGLNCALAYRLYTTTTQTSNPTAPAHLVAHERTRPREDFTHADAVPDADLMARRSREDSEEGG